MDFSFWKGTYLIAFDYLPKPYGPGVQDLGAGAGTPISPKHLLTAGHVAGLAGTGAETALINYIDSVYGATIDEIHRYDPTSQNAAKDIAIVEIADPWWTGYYEIGTVDARTGVSLTNRVPRLWGGWGPVTQSQTGGLFGTWDEATYTIGVRGERYCFGVVNTTGAGYLIGTQFRANTVQYAGQGDVNDSGGGLFVTNPSGYLGVAAVCVSANPAHVSGTQVVDAGGVLETTFFNSIIDNTETKPEWIQSVLGGVLAPYYFGGSSGSKTFFLLYSKLERN